MARPVDDMEQIRRVSRTGSRFALAMLVAALVMGVILTAMSAVQLVQVRRFSQDLLVMRARQGAVAFFIRYARDPQRGIERIPMIVEEAALGTTDFLQVLTPEGELLGSYEGELEERPAVPDAPTMKLACDANLERLSKELPWGPEGRLKLKRGLIGTVLRPASATPRKVGDHHVLDVLFALPLPDRPPPPGGIDPDTDPGPGWHSKKKGMTLDRKNLLGPGGGCMLVRIGVDATTQRRAVLTHVGILLLSILTTLLVMGINVFLYRALKQREQMALSVQRARRVQALGEMAATLAHELKNPVGAIRGYAQLMGESWEKGGLPPDDPEAERLSRAVQTIVRESTRLEDLVSRTLEFTRPGELKIETRDLREIVEAACSVLAGKALDRGVSIVTDQAPAAVMAHVDADRIEQVVANLLDNAIEASEQGGTVTVHTSQGPGGACIEIRDRGRGIASASMASIFRPFYTDRPQGTGLGLAVTRSIVEAHAGTVTAHSDGEGKGATFTVTLPRA